MDNKKAAEMFLKGSNLALVGLLEEIERDEYTTIDQVVAYVNAVLKVNNGLKGGQHE